YAAAVLRHVDVAKQKESDVAKLFVEQQNQVLEDAAKASEYASKQGELTRLQKLIDTLDSRIKEVSLAEDGRPPNITNTEPARAAANPSPPSKLKPLALALISGLLGGLGIAGFRDRYDYPLRSAAQIRATLGIRVLGIIPRMPVSSSAFREAGRIYLDPASDV